MKSPNKYRNRRIYFIFGVALWFVLVETANALAPALCPRACAQVGFARASASGEFGHDPWGQPWLIASGAQKIDPSTVDYSITMVIGPDSPDGSIYSTGPNRRDDNRSGDDIVVWDSGHVRTQSDAVLLAAFENHVALGLLPAIVGLWIALAIRVRRITRLQGLLCRTLLFLLAAIPLSLVVALIGWHAWPVAAWPALAPKVVACTATAYVISCLLLLLVWSSDEIRETWETCPRETCPRECARSCCARL